MTIHHGNCVAGLMLAQRFLKGPAAGFDYRLDRLITRLSGLINPPYQIECIDERAVDDQIRIASNRRGEMRIMSEVQSKMSAFIDTVRLLMIGSPASGRD